MAIEPGNDARRRLLAEERRQALRTVAEFKKIQNRIQAELFDLLDDIEKTRRTIGNANPAQLIKQARLRALFDQVGTEIFKASKSLGLDLAGMQRAAISIAKAQANQVPTLAANLNYFDGPATKALIGIGGDGQDLDRYFERLAKPVRQSMFDALYYGVAAGKPNQLIAREINLAVGNGSAAAMTIARTETNRAYREATRGFYADTPAVIGWRWLAALDLNTCPICWSQHGKIFKTRTKMATHPNCRCTMVAVFAGDPKIETGSDRFAKLTIDQQKTILGPRRFDLYYQGAELADFVETYASPFGTGRKIRNLADTVFEPRPRPAGIPAFPPRSVVKPELATPGPSLSAAQVQALKPRPGDPVPKFAGSNDATAYLESRFPKIKFDMESIDVKSGLLQSTADEITRLLDLYPETAARLKYFGTYTEKSKIPLISSGKFNGEYAHAATNGKYIGLNPGYHTEPVKYARAVSNAYEQGFFSAPGTTSTVTHEFGHAVDAWLKSISNRSLVPGAETYGGPGTIGHLQAQLTRKFKPFIGEQSDYSLKGNPRTQKLEQFAEGFAMRWGRDEKDWSRFTRVQDKLIKLAQAAPTTNPEIPIYALPDLEQRKVKKAINALYKEFGLKEPYLKRET